MLRKCPSSAPRIPRVTCSRRGETRGGYGDGKEEGKWRGKTSNLPEQVLEGRDGGRFATVILVAVDVQHSFTADGEHAREDALLETGAEHDRVVFLIHVRGPG